MSCLYQRPGNPKTELFWISFHSSAAAAYAFSLHWIFEQKQNSNRIGCHNR